MKSRPVILRNVLPGYKFWNWTTETLKAACGDTPVEMASTYGKQVLLTANRSTLAEFEREYNRVFEKTEGRTFREEVKRQFDLGSKPAEKSKLTLAEFIASTAEESRRAPNPLHDYTHIVHYLTPSSMREYNFPMLCPKILTDYGISALLRYVKFDKRDDCASALLDPKLYLAPAKSRAYPAHLHNLYDDGFLYMIQGEKKFVLWNHDEAPKLYPFSAQSFQTEANDPVYSADGLNLDLASQPSLKDTIGWQGTARAGDTIFVPCGSIHLFENVGDETSFAIRSILQDPFTLARAKATQTKFDAEFSRTFGKISAGNTQVFDEGAEDISFVQALRTMCGQSTAEADEL